MAKLTATGTRNGEAVVIECAEYETNGQSRVKVLKGGKREVNAELILHEKIFALQGMNNAGLPEFNLRTLSTYWVALHEVYFDEPPDIKISGDFDTFGLPYSTFDTSKVNF